MAHSLIVLYAPFTLFLAAMIGVLDGSGDRDDVIVSPVLVIGLAALVSFLGLGLPELLQPWQMPIDLRVAMLVVIESVMLLEWGVAPLVRLGRRMLTSA